MPSLREIPLASQYGNASLTRGIVQNSPKAHAFVDSDN